MTFTVARRNLKRTLARFANTGVDGAFRVGWRWLRLHLPLQVSAKPIPARRERVVISLTTIPSRASALGPVLRSLVDQDMPADRIILWRPTRPLRDTGAGGFPAHLPVPEGVEVIECEDLGPATKLLHSLRSETGALVIAVDDDVIYPANLVSTLLNAHRREPGTAFGLRGVRLREGVRFADLWHVLASGITRPEPVDILFGTWGYMVPAWLCDAAIHDYSNHPPEVRWVDDVWVSGHLARLGVPRKVTPSDRFPLETFAALRTSLTGGLNRSGDNDEVAISAFAADWNRTGATDPAPDQV